MTQADLYRAVATGESVRLIEAIGFQHVEVPVPRPRRHRCKRRRSNRPRPVCIPA